MTNLSAAIERIRSGGVVAIPTETVYGLAADAFNPLAVARIFEIKKRPFFDPLIVHIADAAHIHRVATNIPGAAQKLMNEFWPGPLTLVLPKTTTVPDIVTSGLPTVAVRVPDHILARHLIKEAGTPLAAPSANLFGRVSPTTAQHVREQLGDSVDLILDGGPCRVGLESTIVSFDGPRPCVLRLGGLTVEEIERVAGPVNVQTIDPEKPQAPGNLPQHYAPRTPLYLLSAADVPARLAALRQTNNFSIPSSSGTGFGAGGGLAIKITKSTNLDAGVQLVRQKLGEFDGFTTYTAKAGVSVGFPR